MSDAIGSDNIFNVYRMHPGVDGSVKRQLAGRYIVHNDQLQILEDYFGVLHEHVEEGEINAHTARALDALKHSSHYDVVADADVEHGRRLDMIPEEQDLGDPSEEADAQFAGQPTSLVIPNGEPRNSLFTYQRKDMAPQTVEFREGKAYMNGHLLADEELQRLLDHHQTGEASITYKGA